MSDIECPKCHVGRLNQGHIRRDGTAVRRYRCSNRGSCSYSTTSPDSKTVIAPGGHEKTKSARKRFQRIISPKAKIYVITAAQNATPVHGAFWDSLIEYCKFRDAELLVLPIRYKNATSQWTASQRNAEWWLDPPAPSYEVGKVGEETQAQYFARVYPRRKYLWNVRRRLNDNLIVLGDISTQPTAVAPLTGFESITHGESGILGHTKLQLKTVPTVPGRLPKIMTTTGAVTVRNYTDSGAGKKGEFHHTQGAVVLEVEDEKRFHMRQINAEKDTGHFFEIVDGKTLKFTPQGVKDEDYRLEGLALGDIHLRNADKAVLKATFDDLIPSLRPKHVIYHDLLDGETVNHWTEKDPFVSTARSYAGRDKVIEELSEAVALVNGYANKYPWMTGVIAPSNHHDWLSRWLKVVDWKQIGPKNRGTYLELALGMVRKCEGMTPDEAERLDAFIEFAKEKLKKQPNIKVLDYDESYRVVDIECGMHGHLGPNGAKGTARNYARTGVKTVAGDCHSPEIFEGSWRAGTSSYLRRGYNKGPSGWLNTHVAIYPNGKRTMINVINGNWRLK